jgi:ribosomal protein S18 acetylase RimI-like enzyme
MHVDRSIRFTPALPSQREAFREMHHRCYHDVVLRQFGCWDLAQQDGFFEKEWSERLFHTIEEDGCMVGGYAEKESEGCLMLLELQVLPEFQGRGIGTAVIKHMQSRAVKGGRSMSLRVLRQNRAVNLYAKLGFREVGRDDIAIIMEWHGT